VKSYGGDTLTDIDTPWLDSFGDGDKDCTALVLVWSRAEPHRVGQVALFPAGVPARVLGRASSQSNLNERVHFYKQRPVGLEPTQELMGRGMSRNQLSIQPARGGGLRVDNIGRPPCLVNGRQIRRSVVRPGDLLEVQHQLLLYCVQRPAQMSPLRYFDADQVRPFGEPDLVGMVGESPAIWAFRDRLAFLARRDVHVLIQGQSGTGKELAAQAIHKLSRRRDGALISRNAATIPATLADAELFGNVKNYPNPGMPSRPGLIGSSDGGTLFLDEFGDLPTEVQTHLLRVLDNNGEYQRLGDSTPRRVDMRFIAATNRPSEELKPDLVARLKLRANTPPLQERREDVPLLARKLLQNIVAREPDLVRFCRDGEPRVAPDLIARLIQHDYTLHVRELERLLWDALSSSPADYLALTPSVREQLKVKEPRPSGDFTDPDSLDPDEIQAALDQHGGSQEKAYRELGLSSRHVLYRLIKKHNLRT
jgi:two-component system nitrogen regulation response regulator GlnG/two-component system response regulator HydG